MFRWGELVLLSRNQRRISRRSLANSAGFIIAGQVWIRWDEGSTRLLTEIALSSGSLATSPSPTCKLIFTTWVHQFLSFNYPSPGPALHPYPAFSYLYSLPTCHLDLACWTQDPANVIRPYGRSTLSLRQPASNRPTRPPSSTDFVFTSPCFEY